MMKFKAIFQSCVNLKSYFLSFMPFLDIERQKKRGHLNHLNVINENVNHSNNERIGFLSKSD